MRKILGKRMNERASHLQYMLEQYRHTQNVSSHPSIAIYPRYSLILSNLLEIGGDETRIEDPPKLHLRFGS